MSDQVDEKPRKRRRASSSAATSTTTVDRDVEASVIKKLPKGFFDLTPEEEKSQRDVNIESEVPKFYQEIRTETTKVENALEKEQSEVQKERDLDEVETQLKCWEKVNQLQKNADEIKAKVSSDFVPQESDEEIDLAELDDIFINWKSKGSSRLKI
ncbi:uncharacterized protein LOC141849099 [Brevipalpus obovatus]|uniref:uncharacterized protein LOC141849099 n=1 Tax=Brevipalpus obovatus TaxID=246614 RepID=UPI003D9DC305